MNTKKINPFNRIGLALTLGTILMLTVSSVLQVVLQKVCPDFLNSGYALIVLTFITYYLIGFPFMVLLLKRVPDFAPTENRKFSIKQLIKIIVITYGFTQAINIITNIFFVMISLVTGKQMVNPLVEGLSQSAVVANLILTVICAPIFEELFFRKVLLDKLRGYGDTAAIVTTAVLFGLFHMNFSQCFYTTFMGLVLGYVACKSGSVKYSIIIHMVSNIFGGFVLIFASKFPVVVFINLAFAVMMIIAAVILFVTNLKNVQLSKGYVEIEKGNIFSTACINFGMIIYFVLCFAYMILLLVR